MYGEALAWHAAVLHADPRGVSVHAVRSTRRILSLVRQAMELALPFESLYWLVYNGTQIIYDVCSRLVAGGLARDCLEFLLWAVFSIETSLPLLACGFVDWRAHLYVAVHNCYVDIGKLDDGRKFIGRALAKLLELHHLEYSDGVPPEPEAARKLADALTAVRIANFGYVLTSTAVETGLGGSPGSSGGSAGGAGPSGDSGGGSSSKTGTGGSGGSGGGGGSGSSNSKGRRGQRQGSAGRGKRTAAAASGGASASGPTAEANSGLAAGVPAEVAQKLAAQFGAGDDETPTHILALVSALWDSNRRPFEVVEPEPHHSLCLAALEAILMPAAAVDRQGGGSASGEAAAGASGSTRSKRGGSKTADKAAIAPSSSRPSLTIDTARSNAEDAAGEARAAALTVLHNLPVNEAVAIVDVAFGYGAWELFHHVLPTVRAIVVADSDSSSSGRALQKKSHQQRMATGSGNARPETVGMALAAKLALLEGFAEWHSVAAAAAADTAAVETAVHPAGRSNSRTAARSGAAAVSTPTRSTPGKRAGGGGGPVSRIASSASGVGGSSARARGSPAVAATGAGGSDEAAEAEAARERAHSDAAWAAVATVVATLLDVCDEPSLHAAVSASVPDAVVDAALAVYRSLRPIPPHGDETDSNGAGGGAGTDSGAASSGGGGGDGSGVAENGERVRSSVSDFLPCELPTSSDPPPGLETTALLAAHRSLAVVAFDDLAVRTRIALELAHLLEHHGRVADAIDVLEASASQLSSYRDALAQR